MTNQPGQFMPPPERQPGGQAGMPQPYGAYAGAPMPVGPPGKPRSIGKSIGLSIITIGFYNYWWVWYTHEDIKRNSGVGVDGLIGFIIYLVIAPVTWFLLPYEINQMMTGRGQPCRVSGLTGFWLLLPLAGPFVWFVKVQGQLNDYWQSQGAVLA